MARSTQYFVAELLEENRTLVFVGVAAAATRRCIGCNAGGDHWGAGGHHWWAGSTPFAEGDILASVAVGSEAAVVPR